jgi:LmbE family N-acetylglucosaminyl deacetylase
MRILVFGRRPDDCATGAGGAALKWTRLGHAVRFASSANGPSRSAELLGVECLEAGPREGEALARAWRADLVLIPRGCAFRPADVPEAGVFFYNGRTPLEAPDVAVAIDDVIGSKLAALNAADSALFSAKTEPLRRTLGAWYGARRAAFIEFAEGFESARPLSRDEIRRHFPFLPAETAREDWRQAP